MSATYQQPIVIPKDFPALLKAFTREILRSQPDNIYEFGAQYFQGLLGSAPSARAAPSSQQADEGMGLGLDGPVNPEEVATFVDIANLTPAELEPLLMKLFIDADADRSGYLDRGEFMSVLRSANLKLTEKQVRQILAEADENDDAVIQYKEFLPIMIDILQSIKAKEQARSMMHNVATLVRSEVETMLLHGLPQDELEALMLKVFRKADADNSGQLNRHEFKDALKAAELGLTRKDINLILSHIDVDKDGLVSYEEFIPVCFQVLVERFKDEIVASDIFSNTDELQQMLLSSFKSADPDGQGLLTQRQVKALLKDLSYQVLGLTTLQMVSILSQAPTTPDGLVQYVQFVPMAASIIRSLYDVDSMKSRMNAIKVMSDAGGMQRLSGLDLESLRSTLEAAFKEVDAEGRGQLDQEQVIAVLGSLNSLPNVNLSESHMKAMFAAIDADESGTVDWSELTNFICDALEHMEREALIANMALQEGGDDDEVDGEGGEEDEAEDA